MFLCSTVPLIQVSAWDFSHWSKHWTFLSPTKCVDAYFSRSVNVNIREWDRTQILKVDVVYFICLDDVVTSQNSKKCLVQTYPSDIFAAAGGLYYSVWNLRLLILWGEERERVVSEGREGTPHPFLHQQSLPWQPAAPMRTQFYRLDWSRGGRFNLDLSQHVVCWADWKGFHSAG